MLQGGIMQRCVATLDKALFFQFCAAEIKKALICLQIWVVALTKAKHNPLTIKRN